MLEILHENPETIPRNSKSDV